MHEPERIYDPAIADGRFQLEVLGLRWGLVAIYAVLTWAGVVHIDLKWFAISEGWLVAYHCYYTWYVWHEFTQEPLPPATAYATPFMDTVAVSLALIGIGDPLYPIWAVYFFIIVGVTFFYYPVARTYVIWLLANYAVVGMMLQLLGKDVPAPQMGVATIILLAGMYNLVAYTDGERRLRRRIAQTARTDPLTNLLNRRGLEEALAQHLEDAEAGGTAVAVFMADVDHFKRVNDQFGHLAADSVLEQLGELLANSVRDRALVARYGGDEFVVIVPEVTPDDAVIMAERLRYQVARMGLCTISIGVSISSGQAVSSESMLTRADGALMLAKKSGRNCVKAPGLAPAQVA